jgi:hypothetical protein
VGCRFPDREIKEPWSSWGREEEDPVRAGVPAGAAAVNPPVTSLSESTEFISALYALAYITLSVLSCILA